MRHGWLPKPRLGTQRNSYRTMNGPRNGFCLATHFARSRTAAGPVLELKSRDTLELAFIVGDEGEPRGFGVSSNPEIVAADHLTAGLQRCANLAVGRRGFPRQGNHRQKRYKAPERFQSICPSLASLCAIM